MRENLVEGITHELDLTLIQKSNYEKGKNIRKNNSFKAEMQMANLHSKSKLIVFAAP